jgi:Flp pilus assembly CpaE family ATPase
LIPEPSPVDVPRTDYLDGTFLVGRALSDRERDGITRTNAFAACALAAAMDSPGESRSCLAFLGAKGGDGTSTIAANGGVALARARAGTIIAEPASFIVVIDRLL